MLLVLFFQMITESFGAYRGLLVCLLVPFLLSWPLHANLLRDHLSDTDQEVVLDIVDKDLGGFGKIGGQVQVEVRPNEDKKTFTRIESLSADVALGPDLQRGPIGLLFQGAHARQFKVFRQFQTLEATYNLKASPPLKPNQLPMDARKALEFPEDVTVQFVVNMAIQLGVTVSRSHGISSASLGVKKYIQGDFFVEMKKVSKNQMLVRWLGTRDQSRSIFTQFGLSSEVGLFTIKPLKTAVADRLEIRNQVEVERHTGKLFTFEYSFDLSNPVACEAFDNFLSPFRWKRAGEALKKGVRTLRKGSEDELMVATTQPLDLAISRGNSGVEFLSGARAKYQSIGRKVGIRLNLLQGQRDNIYSEFDFSFEDENRETQSYRVADFTLKTWVKALFETLRWQVDVSVNGILSLVPREDSSFSVDEFLGLHISFSRDEGQRNTVKQVRMKRLLRRMLPSEVYSKSGLENLIEVETQKDARLSYDLVFHRDAFLKGSQLSHEEILDIYDRFIDEISDDASYRRGYFGNTWGQNSAVGGGLQFISGWERSHGGDVKRLRRQLPKIFSRDTKATKDARWKNFVELRDSFLFKKIGIGLLNRIIYAADKKSGGSDFLSGVFLTVDLVYRRESSSLPNTIHAEFGQTPNLQVIDQIKKLKTRILNREFRP